MDCTPIQMYFIKSLIEKDFETGNALYWSNDLGWVDRESATQFTGNEIARTALVGLWIKEKV
jgi:hypothetical protein